jgi:putative copper export protein/cytochrome c553
VALANTANNQTWSTVPSLDQWFETMHSTDLGRAMLVRYIVLALVLSGALLLRRPPQRGLLIAGAAITLAALATFSLTGHARAVSRPELAVGIDTAHLAAAALWGGGIALLGWYLILALRGTGDQPVAIAAVERFSRIALLAMAIVVGSGIVSSAFHVSGPRNLTGESYGKTLVIKILLVFGVLVVAGTNRLFIVPRLRATASLTTAHLQRMRLSALVEVLFAVLILVAAARLTELPPADGPLTVDVAGRSGPITLEATTGDLVISVAGQLDPADGDTMTVTVRDAATGQPVTDLARVIVLATAPDPLDPSGAPLRDRFDATAVADAPGQYAFPRTRLGIQTSWQIEVTARRLGVEDANTTFSLDLIGAGAQPPRLVDDHWRWPDLPWTGWLALAAAVASFAGGLLVIRRLRGLEPVTGAIFLVVVTLISGAFLLSAYRSGPIPTSGASLQNPVGSSDPIIASARDTFAARCASCHGVDGLGTDRQESHGHTGGTNALTSSQANRLSDGDLYTLISNGVGGTEMPAFDRALTEEQRWQLVALIRLFQDQAKTQPAP